MTTKTSEQYKKDYTQPQLREQLKEDIKQDTKGGPVGQWSARKAQLLTKRYEAEGGGYVHQHKRTKAQQHLKKWQEK